MHILYCLRGEDLRTYVDIGLTGDKVALSFEEPLGEFLCRVLNGTLYAPSYAQRQNDALLRKGEKLLEGEATHRSFAARLKEELRKADMGAIRRFTDYVLLEGRQAAQGCSMKQRFFAYEAAFGKAKPTAVSPLLQCGYDEPRSEEEDGALQAILQKEKGDGCFSSLCGFLQETNGALSLGNLYAFEDFGSFLLFYLQEMVQRGVGLKLCPNCGRYFLPLLRSDTIYCNNVSPQDRKHTCREYGAQKRYRENLKQNEAMGLYRGVYMSKQMLAKRHEDIPEYRRGFLRYREEAKQWKAEVKRGAKTQREFILWLKEQKEKKY